MNEMITKNFNSDVEEEEEDSLNDLQGNVAEDQLQQNIEDELEEEPETHINSNGSVLMPSDCPYDKFEKIKEANNELFTVEITKPKSPCKVHFSQTVVTHSVECDDTLDESILTEVDEDPCPVEEAELNSSTESSDSNSTVICRPSKVLLVTVPTAFTEQVDDGDGEDVDDDDVDDDDDDVVDDDVEEEDETYEITNVDIPDNDSQQDSVDGDKHSEEEVIIEDLTDVIVTNVLPVSTPFIHHHKPVLTKDARIEEDSDSEIDVRSPVSTSNNFNLTNEYIENLIEDLQECSISTQIENENITQKKTEKYEDKNIDEKMIKAATLSPQNTIKTNAEQKVKKEEKKLKNIKSKSLMSKTNSPNIRVQCPIFRRNYGSQCSLKKDGRTKSTVPNRPSTAPSKRHCCNYWDQDKLPEYRGLRSEYGLTAEQLLQRKRDKFELTKNIRLEKERKYMEEIRRQKENDQIFHSWLVKKKKEAAQKFSRKKLQSTFQFKTMAAPTKHLDKVGALRKKLLKREHTSYSLEEFFKNANPHEQKTYRIYLGLFIE